MAATIIAMIHSSLQILPAYCRIS